MRDAQLTCTEDALSAVESLARRRDAERRALPLPLPTPSPLPPSLEEEEVWRQQQARRCRCTGRRRSVTSPLDARASERHDARGFSMDVLRT